MPRAAFAVLIVLLLAATAVATAQGSNPVWLPLVAEVPTPTATNTPTATAGPTAAPTVTPTPGRALSGIANGDFERGHTSWTETPSANIITKGSVAGVAPYAGSWFAVLGGYNYPEDEISQVVTVPNQKPVYLSMVYQFRGDDEFDVVQIVIGNKVLWEGDSRRDDASTWTPLSLDVSAYAGQEVTIRWYIYGDESVISRYFLDNVTFRSSP